MKPISRRQFCLSSSTLLLAGAAHNTTFASTPARFPNGPVTLVVPYATGGAADLLARALAIKLGERWGQAVTVDNKLGASGQLGTELVGKSTGDPYKLLLGTQAVFAVLPTLSNRKDFNVNTGFTPISLLIKMPSVILAPSALKVGTLEEFVALLRAGRAEQYSFSSNGAGTSQHLIAEDFLGRIGVKAVHVPYRGSTQALTALAAGDQIALSVDNIPSALPFIQSGRVKALAVTTPTRASQLPDVPTVAQTLPGFDQSTWMGLMAPANISADTQQFINREVQVVLNDPDVRRSLHNMAFLPQSGTSEEFRSFVNKEVALFKDLLTRLGLVQA